MNSWCPPRKVVPDMPQSGPGVSPEVLEGILATSLSSCSTHSCFVSDCDFRREFEDVRSLDYASLPKLSCFSKAELDLSLSFSLLPSLLFFTFCLLGVSLPSGPIYTAALSLPTNCCWLSPKTAGSGPPNDLPPPPPPPSAWCHISPFLSLFLI